MRGAAYDSPTKWRRGNTGNLYETWYIGTKNPETGKNRERTAKRKRERQREKQSRWGNKGKEGKNFPPAPDSNWPMAKMQNPLEICKIKGDREIAIEVPNKRYGGVKRRS